MKSPNLSARWSPFGHILRRDKDIPANKTTRANFIPNGNKLRGRPKTTLPIVFNRDIALIQHPIRLPRPNNIEPDNFVPLLPLTIHNRSHWLPYKQWHSKTLRL